MPRVTDGLYDEENMRWSIAHTEDDTVHAGKKVGGEPMEIRLTQLKSQPRGCFVSLFPISDETGTERMSMGLRPERVRQLITDLQDALRVIEGGN